MYPAQTSLIPVQIALARFIEQGGPSASSGLYPYWYLGTTPFRYLTGPILPFLLVGIHKVFPNLSLFTIFYLLITIFWVIGGIGVYWLVYSLHHPRSPSRLRRGFGGQVGPPRRCFTAFLAAIFYLSGPIVPFLFRFSDGVYLIAFSLLPFILLMYLNLLRSWTRKLAVFSIIAISFVILLDSLIIPSLLLGMAAILLVTTSWGKIEKVIKKSIFYFLFSIFFCTLWYTPGYWLTLLGAPSFGGRGLTQVAVWLGKLLPTVLALTVAFLSVKFFKKKNPLRDFCFYWLFIFGFLTLVRFLSDPDFWLDWSAYGTELQMGIGMALGAIMKNVNRKNQNDILKSKTFYILLCGFTFYILLFAFIFNKYVLGTVQRDITKTVGYRIGDQLSQIVKPGETVFLSGTTVFWLNAFFDIPQVRGGKDQVSVHPTWRQAVWEIREGEDPQKALEWLKKLGVDYLVVHSQDSEEFYHDFRSLEKFENISGLKKIYEEKGDRIYQVRE